MSELGDKIRALKRKDPTTYADMQWDFALDRAAALADAHAATVAAAREAAADTAIQHISKIQVNEPLWHEGQDWAADRISQAILAIAPIPPHVAAARVLLDVMDSAVWRSAIAAMEPILRADIQPTAWNSEDEIMSALTAALEQIAKDGE